MVPQTPVVLPVLTTRTKVVGKIRHAPITARLKHKPYPMRREGRPISMFTPTSQVLDISSGAVLHVSTPSGSTTSTPTPHTVKSGEGSSPGNLPLVPLVQNNGLIPKPHGEPGRLTRGYSVDGALKAWADVERNALKVSIYSHLGSRHYPYNVLQELIKLLAQQHLNTALSYNKQESLALGAVRRKVSGFPRETFLAYSLQASEAHPRLHQYEDKWPVDAIIKTHLKNTAAKTKKAKAKKADAQLGAQTSPRRSSRNASLPQSS